ncbi:phasin family protein [Caldimonas thermodepolymerans]|jgi:poly(hydroxyalkanoate) granule-associated protein|uniref:Poly(Hydroxyalkanoate) granule-associated protein n=1 Tax=Caldimonas thermodepolymerans TaxID=215580 RepID=A0AA46DFQ7_9BURK|nr:phasin family protein [Caldimonas thermodepolymerans]TCP08028.1 poly(hydroxyalkanoate) granule-associated protein [Caldimonas thermodepolymerans]UZG45100.1 phasin family protein [Caldimonas thermodepolymerans]UZG48847.1 phasin family protein [Caldimonas thermodepolymerans]
MVTKQQRTAGRRSSAADAPGAEFTGTIRDSAQQIWLAGLGAFSKAQEEGSKVFETLVKEGVTLQRKTQAAAEDKLAEVTRRMSEMAGDWPGKAAPPWNQLESLFEQRVAKALHKLGLPSREELDALGARIEALTQTVQRLQDTLEQQAPAAPAAARRRRTRKTGGE